MKNSELLEGAYRSEKKHLLNWLTSRVGIDEAEDILHDVFLRTAVNLDTSQAIVNLQSWLWQSVRNMLIDRWRKKRYERSMAEEDSIERIIDDMRKSTEDEFEQRELLKAFKKAVQKLSPEQKEVITAQLINGETFAELSARTGVSINTLAARKRYALAAVRRILTTDFSGDTGGTI